MSTAEIPAATAGKKLKKKTVQWGEAPKIGFIEALYLPAIAGGIATALKHAFFKKRSTAQYPEQKPEMPPNYRGVHRLNRDEEGRVKCVACYMCQTACPANCIEIIAAPAPQDDPKWANRDKYPATFTIDELRCIYCGMCEEACPGDAIELTSIYDLTGMSREELIFDKEKLLSVFDETSKAGLDPVRTNRGELGPASEKSSQSADSPPPPGRGKHG